MGVNRAIGDPVLPSFGLGGMNDELIRRLVVRGSGLHLDSVVTVAELGETEAPDLF